MKHSRNFAADCLHMSIPMNMQFEGHLLTALDESRSQGSGLFGDASTLHRLLAHGKSNGKAQMKPKEPTETAFVSAVSECEFDEIVVTNKQSI